MTENVQWFNVSRVPPKENDPCGDPGTPNGQIIISPKEEIDWAKLGHYWSGELRCLNNRRYFKGTQCDLGPAVAIPQSELPHTCSDRKPLPPYGVCEVRRIWANVEQRRTSSSALPPPRQPYRVRRHVGQLTV